MASATCSTWIGGIVSAFAIESRDDPPAGEKAELSDRRMRDGVGILEGAFECKDADRSRRAATGDVIGR
jgi:hypothetical protein